MSIDRRQTARGVAYDVRLRTPDPSTTSRMVRCEVRSRRSRMKMRGTGSPLTMVSTK
jgi:hypothetical protein